MKNVEAEFNQAVHFINKNYKDDTDENRNGNPPTLLNTVQQMMVKYSFLLIQV